MSKDNFKLFVRKHPELIQYVNNDQMTWQKFYDMYTLYGEENREAWSRYFKTKESTALNTAGKKEFKINDIVEYIKSVDMESLQRGIAGIEKAIGFVQDLGIIKSDQASVRNYQPRPIYKSFED